MKFVEEGFQKGLYNKFIGESLNLEKGASMKAEKFDDTK